MTSEPLVTFTASRRDRFAYRISVLALNLASKHYRDWLKMLYTWGLEEFDRRVLAASRGDPKDISEVVFDPDSLSGL